MSPKIKILPEKLINIIAAGEVVERPASIVKELIENSIDADATKIDISISGSGKKSITIIDNGYGMTHDNALLALERHATSKIENLDDLLSINSFGFRGEALPSIAAVSNFILTTRSKTSTIGTQINVKGGTILNVEQIGSPIGTKIVVLDLFSNIPARAKFLKNDATELSHIIQTVIRESIPKPEISFSLTHNNRSILKLPGISEIIKRIYQIHGEDIIKQLIPIDAKHENISIYGYISNPALNRPDCLGEYLYINKRYIRNPLIQKIIHQSYRNRLPNLRYPMFVLLLQMPGHLVDFNVHPAKLEVRFSQTKEILKAIQESINESLNRAYKPSDFKIGSMQNIKNGVLQNKESNSLLDSQRVLFQNSHNNSIENERPDTIYKNYDSVKSKPNNTYNYKTFFSQNEICGNIDDIFIVCSPFLRLHNSYIIYQSKAGLTMIDQHAAHERINYERFRSMLLKKNIPRQNLITPPSINVSPDEEVFLNEALPLLKEFGFELEIFGPHTLILRTVPLYFKADPTPLLIEIVNQIKEMGGEIKKDRVIEELAAKMACHNSIRAKENIENEEISILIKQLSETKEPFFCPHGRPTVLNMTIHEIEKKFGRIK